MRSNLKFPLAVLFISAAFIFIIGCSSTDNEPITIKGSTTMVPLMQQMAIAYNQHLDVKIDIEAVGSVNGLKALIQKKALIACSSVPVSDELIAEALKNNVNIKAFPIGSDRITAIVNTKSPVDKLTRQQLKELFTGKISNWSSIGGDDKPVSLVERKESSGTHQVWAEKVLQSEKFAPTDYKASSNSGVLARVAENENAVGYISAAYLNNEVKQVHLIENDEDTPIGRTLFLYVDNNRFTKSLKAFISFLYSEPAKILIANNGFVPDARVKPPATNL